MLTFMFVGELHTRWNATFEVFQSLLKLNKAFFFVFRDAKQMARDVHEVIEKVVREEGGMSESEASAFVKKMEAQKRYSADVWS
jgi:NADPH-ferrihemoprotein reductase